MRNIYIPLRENYIHSCHAAPVAELELSVKTAGGSGGGGGGVQHWADPGFLFRGAHNIICPHAHYERGTELTFGRLSSWVVLMLSRAI